MPQAVVTEVLRLQHDYDLFYSQCRPSKSGTKERGAGRYFMLHACRVGQIVTFFTYTSPSRNLGSPTLTQPGRVANPTRDCPGALWEAPQAVCWLLGREPKPPA